MLLLLLLEGACYLQRVRLECPTRMCRRQRQRRQAQPMGLVPGRLLPAPHPTL